MPVGNPVVLTFELAEDPVAFLERDGGRGKVVGNAMLIVLPELLVRVIVKLGKDGDKDSDNEGEAEIKVLGVEDESIIGPAVSEPDKVIVDRKDDKDETMTLVSTEDPPVTPDGDVEMELPVVRDELVHAYEDDGKDTLLSVITVSVGRGTPLGEIVVVEFSEIMMTEGARELRPDVTPPLMVLEMVIIEESDRVEFKYVTIPEIADEGEGDGDKVL